MPPSALRTSLAKEVRTENHRRGRGLEGGLLFREKDDDLAVFRDMQNRERDNFLLLSADDLEDSLSTKLRYFSDLKLGISIPPRGESSELLNADGEKNDYDWLLTPPETPLFPSLDDEPLPANLIHRGRPRSQPISISRSAKMEKNYRTSRSSASPNRLSPSPRSGNSTVQASRSSASPHRLSASAPSTSSTLSPRGRPSSARQTSPTPSFQSATPSRRPSTPPSKPMSAAPRSSTPTFRGMSTGSSSLPSSYGSRAPSLAKATWGSSTSPKLQAWQSTLPGFSSDPPPNLRTSLSDRPASYVRGLSPASSTRSGRGASLKVRRQSISPTASRSVSSSHSHERDHFSSQSRGSVASSGDDNMDSPHSVFMGVSDSPSSRNDRASMSSKALAFSKKPSTRTLSASSVPKRCFDSVLRQVDKRKSPQNMFRPLLSSVPTTTFYVRKANSAHRTMISRNSSVTTSSNTSSEQGASVAHDTEGSDHDQDIIASEYGKAPNPCIQEEIFIFDKVDEVSEEVGHEDSDENPSTNLVERRQSGSRQVAEMDAAPTCESSFVMVDPIDADSCEMMALCSICGNKFHIVEMTDETDSICPECAEKCGISSPLTANFYNQNNTLQNDKALEDNKLSGDLQFEMGINELQELEKNNTQPADGQQDRDVKNHHSCLPDSYPVQVTDEEVKQHILESQCVEQQDVYTNQSSSLSERSVKHFNSLPRLRVDGSEGTGISLVLKRSSSGKWPVLQGKVFNAANVVCEDPSYTREIVNAMKGSFGPGSASASSSIDLSSAKQIEACIQRQMSGTKSNMEYLGDDSNLKDLSKALSLSKTPSDASEALGRVKSNSEENCDSIRDMKREEQGRYQENADLGSSDTSFINIGVHEDSNHDNMNICQVVDTSTSELSSHSGMQLGESTLAEFLNVEGSVSSGNFAREADVEVSMATAAESPVEEDLVMQSSGHGIEASNPPALSTSCMKLERVEDGHDSSAVSPTCSTNSENVVETGHDTLVTSVAEKDLLGSAHETNVPGRASNIDEQSAITLEGPGGQRLRSLTLDEATDTILFCSSIIHDLAYRAASIAMEKEDPLPLENSWPTAMILGKAASPRRDINSRIHKRALKSRKVRQKQLEADSETTSTNTEYDAKVRESMTNHDSSLPNKVDSLKPPKLESKCNCTIM